MATDPRKFREFWLEYRDLVKKYDMEWVSCGCCPPFIDEVGVDWRPPWSQCQESNESAPQFQSRVLDPDNPGRLIKTCTDKEAEAAYEAWLQ